MHEKIVQGSWNTKWFIEKGVTRNVFKKDKRRRIKKGNKQHKAKYLYIYLTHARKLRMITVKDQWTAILANFVRK